jgi:formate-dependent nitrite reductase membrane component NrfD
MDHHFGFLFWAGGIFIGLVLPLAIGFAIVLWFPKQDWIFKVTRLATSLMILVGAFIFRYCIVVAGQIV